MSRTLVVGAFAVFAACGIAPVAAMLARLDLASLAGLLDERTLSLLGRTLTLGGGVAAVALALGVPFGFLTARTDLPGRSLLRPLGVVPFLLPPLFLAITWEPLSDLRGAAASIAVLGLSTFPLVAIFAGRAFERIDARREEAALLAGGLRAAVAMALPLVAPPALTGACLAFVFAVNDFAVPDFLSTIGPKFNVYADEIFLSWNVERDPGRAVAVALPLIALSLAALVPALAMRRRGAFATLDAGFRAPAPLRLGRARWPAFALALALVAVAALWPLGRLLWEAGVAGPEGWSGAKLAESFGLAIERARTHLSFSLAASAAAACACLPLGLVLGHAVERVRSRALGHALETATLLPLAAPAILFGIGTIAVWNRPLTEEVYRSDQLALVLFVGRFAVFAVLLMSGAVASLHRSQEEAAALARAGPLRRLSSIVAPQLRPALAGAWIIVFVLAMRELDAAILVPAANSTAVFRIYNAVHFGRDAYVAALCLVLAFTLLAPGLVWSLLARRRLEVLP